MFRFRAFIFFFLAESLSVPAVVLNEIQMKLDVIDVEQDQADAEVLITHAHRDYVTPSSDGSSRPAFWQAATSTVGLHLAASHPHLS